MITLTQLLQDCSKELGETTLNTTTNRIAHANDAVNEFFNEKRFSFQTKLDSTLITVVDQKEYSLTTITDLRRPGGIKEIVIGTESSSNKPYTPINYQDRFDYTSGNYFYIDDENDELVFVTAPATAGEAIHIRYWYLPERIEDIDDVVGFPIPARYRKALGLLCSANVQYARYLTSEGNSKFNQYQAMLDKVVYNDAERSRGNVKKMRHPLAQAGFRRRYNTGVR